MKRVILVAALAAMTPLPASAETLTNDSVVALTAAGLGDQAIVAKIKGSDGTFDLSTDQMVVLKNRGVSGAVIAAMLEKSSAPAAKQGFSVTSADPALPHPSGVYLIEDWLPNGTVQRLEPTMSNQAKTGGLLGYALTGGIASMSVKASVPNETSRHPSPNKRPSFLFFFDESNPDQAMQTSAWSAGTAAVVTAPSEFTLVRLMAKKGRREARVGSINIGGAKTGVMDKDQLAFDYDLVRPGVYRVTPRAALLPGEYGFIYSLSGGGANGALTARIFDFTVK